MPHNTKYIFISGGVLSGLGKGTVSASLCYLLKSHGFKVVPVKCENYLNLDAGLINPIEHGDPFLCEDGAETDMDLGTYERFLDINLSMENFITMGQIYKTVIDKERNFFYKGEDVEAIPHVTDEIIQRIKKVGDKNHADIVVIELGGTAGEYQNALYYEASRIMKLKYGDTVVHVHVSYLPTPPHLGEPKTKPTQLSVKLLNSMGIQPDFIVARADRMIDTRRMDRFALFCNVVPEHIISSPDVPNVYELPLIFNKQQFSEKILKLLHLPAKKLELSAWKKLVNLIQSPKKTKVNIAVVGKYFASGEYHLTDSYASLIEAINHAGWHSQVAVKIKQVNSEKINPQNVAESLQDCQGIIVPIGWGPRGVDGMIEAIHYARVHKIPYLGLCFGMQLAVVEFARNVAHLVDANTTEVNPKTKYPVVYIIPEQKRNLKLRAYGGTMRLGRWECRIKPDTLAYKIYNNYNIYERHRHRYEFNDAYASTLTKAGLIISGLSVKENLVEIIELSPQDHPFFMGTQGHPEYKSRPLNPHPIFMEFVKACTQALRSVES
ncbi:MAG: CTP synthase [Candidatus Beckwithbacteria bacterium]|nr:CTP synthase [Candidatus Beckwithbacteria bacterium]